MSALADLLPADALATDAELEPLAWIAEGLEALVRPGTVAEVVDVLRWATREGVGVVAVGSGDHVGPRRAAGRCVVVSMRRLAEIAIYEPADLTLTAGAGIGMETLAEELTRHRQWLPVDPPHLEGRTLGGLVAVGLSGPLATGYGALRNHVLGATVVTGDGRVLKLGGRVVKNVAGFDLLRPMVGSAGRLGVLTSVCVRLFPVPEVDALLVARGTSLAGLLPVARAVATAPVLPVSVIVGAPIGGEAGGPAVVVRLHGAETTVAADRRTLERHVGMPLERLAEAEVAAMAARVRDVGTQRPTVLRITVLSTRLADLLALVERLPDADLLVDACGGVVRLGAPAAALALVNELRGSVEALGGSLVVERAPEGTGALPMGSASRPEEAELALGLARVFDPEGVFRAGFAGLEARTGVARRPPTGR